VFKSYVMHFLLLEATTFGFDYDMDSTSGHTECDPPFVLFLSLKFPPGTDDSWQCAEKVSGLRQRR
jgi:hypothetical protein